MKTIKQIFNGAAATLFATSTLFIMAPVAVRAAVDVCTWTGVTSDNFNTATNWTCSTDGVAVPEAGDSLVFDNTSLTGDKTLNNDIGTLSLGSITFQGTTNKTFALGGGSFTLTGNVANNSSAVQKFDTNITLAANVTFSSTGYAIDIGSLADGGSLDLGAFTATFSGNGYITIYENISGSGNIVKNGSGSLKFDNTTGGTNTFTGTVSVNQGQLWITSASSLGTTAGGTTVADGAMLLVQLQSSAPQLTLNEPLTIAGDGDGVGFTNYALYVSTCQSSGCVDSSDLTLSGPITLTADTAFYASQNGKITITGALSGNFKLAMAGGAQGQIILSANPNGSATPNGTLRAPAETKTYEGDQSSAPVTVGYNQTAIVTGIRQDVYVGEGGILKGTGTVRNVEITSGGTLAPGLSPGCLNTGNLTFSAGSTYEFEVGGVTECTEYDQTKVTGTVDLGSGTLKTILFNSYKPKTGDKYTIISNDAAEAITGTFKDLAEGDSVTVDGYVLKISYVGGDGNDVVLTVQTVPGTPDTGFSLTKTNPLVTLALSTALAGALMFLARRSNKITRLK